MYRVFDLRLDENILKEEFFKSCFEIGVNEVSSVKENIEAILNDVTDNGTIDGTALTEGYFPSLKRDVFISYSHNDQSLAHMVVGMLSECFGLSAFMDSMIWGSADELLKRIDQKYCLQRDRKTYSYNKRNFSTAHVHAMLTSAIMKTMDQAEILLFINTPNSVEKVENRIRKEKYDSRTLSPWIYEEVLLSSMLRERDWCLHRCGQRLDENALMHFEKNLKISYKLSTKTMISLNLDDIEIWHKMYIERNRSTSRKYGNIFSKAWEKHPLNILYELKCGIEEETYDK